MEKIKILLVSHAFVNERFRASVADELAKFSDFEIKMISPLKASTTHNNLAYLSDKGVGNYKLIPSKTYFTERQTFIIYGKELKNTIKKWRPDIIDIFDETPWSFCVAQTIWLCKKYSPKTKVVFFSDNNVKRNWGGKRFFYRLIERYNCINADRIYFPVRGGTYEKLVKEIGYKGKFSYISSSVDMEKFHRSPAKKIRNLRKKIGLRNNDILLGIIGGLGRYQGTFFKGTLTALNALSNLPGNYKLLIMGKGKDEDKKYLNNYAKKRGIDGSRIIIPGFVDEKEIVDYY